jgi:hypothetical protein
MEFLGQNTYLLLILIGAGVLLLVMLFALKKTLKMAKTCLVLGFLGVVILLAAVLFALWALAR